MNAPLQRPPRITGRHAVRGATAVAGAQVVKILMQMLSVIVLSRLLTPSDFGVVAMTAPISGFLMIFQGLGLNQAAVQAISLTPAQQSALFKYNVTASALIGLAFIVISPGVAWFYNDERAGYMLAAFTINVLIAGLGLQHNANLNRELRFSAFSAIDAASSVIALLATIVAALYLKSYWAIWIGALCAAIWSTAAVWVVNPWRPSLRVKFSEASDLFRFGLNVTGANILGYAMRNVDNVLIAKFWGAGPLGLYDRAYRLMMFPLQNISRPLSTIFVPILARLRDDPDRYRRTYLSVLRLLCMAIIPGAAAAAATAYALIPLLLGERWIAAAPIFAWLALTMVTQPVGSTNQWLFLTTNRAHLMLRWTLFGAPLSIAAFSIGVFWGPEGVAIAYCISSFVKLPFLVQRFTDSTPVSMTDVFHPLMVTGAGAGAGLGLVHLLGALHLPAIPFIAATLFSTYSFALAFNLATPRGRTDLLFTSRQILMAIR